MAQSANDWTDCRGNVTNFPQPSQVNPFCFAFNNAWGTNATTVFTVDRYGVASVCIATDIDGTGGAAVVDVQWCMANESASANTCYTLDTLSDGDCNSYTDGDYRFDVTTAPAGVERGKIEIRGISNP